MTKNQKSSTFFNLFFHTLINMEQQQLPEPNQIVENLMSKGIRQVEIMRKLGVEKGGFNSWRNSTSASRRREMSQKLIEVFGIEIQPDIVQEPAQTQTYEKGKEKYVLLLEETIKDLRDQVEWLRHEVEVRNEQIREILKKQ